MATASSASRNVNTDITVDRFPVEGEGVVRLEVALLGFDSNKSSASVVSAAAALDEANSWRVAGIAPLCAFGAAHPNVQRKHWIVGLGSVGRVGGGRLVPVLGRRDAGRDLSLYGWGLDWVGFYRFLLVRNASKLGVQASA